MLSQPRRCTSVLAQLESDVLAFEQKSINRLIHQSFTLPAEAFLTRKKVLFRNRIKSLLSMRKPLLGDSFKPQLAGCANQTS